MNEQRGASALREDVPDIGRPYYRAVTALNVLSLFRTAAQLEVEGSLVEASPPPLYQQIAAKAKHLHELGMSNRAIAGFLGVDDKTVAKAVRWCRSRDG